MTPVAFGPSGFFSCHSATWIWPVGMSRVSRRSHSSTDALQEPVVRCRASSGLDTPSRTSVGTTLDFRERRPAQWPRFGRPRLGLAKTVDAGPQVTHPVGPEIRTNGPVHTYGECDINPTVGSARPLRETTPYQAGRRGDLSTEVQATRTVSLQPDACPTISGRRADQWTASRSVVRPRSTQAVAR